MTQRWTISEITRYLRGLFEMDYRLQDLEVEGEISNISRPKSGHIYFTLKDANAELKGVMWRSVAQRLTTLPEHGDRVIAQGKIAVYEQRGQYQLYCEQIRPAGQGDLHAQYEALKAKLLAEGLFDEENKQPIPQRPNRIGIVTSPGAAALQDALNILRRRYPLAEVILSPTPVQGDQAPPQIVAALEALIETAAPDVILVIRGGGALEDLWCFNDERVVRAIAACPIPLISGVGHEIDHTLTDFAADLRAPTPSAAAEQVTAITADDLHTAIQMLRRRLEDALVAQIDKHRRRLDESQSKLRYHSPQVQIDQARQNIDMAIGRAGLAVQSAIRLEKSRLAGLQKTLEAVNPEATLKRGYAVIIHPDGQAINSIADVSPGSEITIKRHDGRINARVDSVEK